MSQADLPTYIVTYQLTNRSLYISSVHVALRKKELINNEHQLALSRDQLRWGKRRKVDPPSFLSVYSRIPPWSCLEVPVRRSGFQKTTGTAFRRPHVPAQFNHCLHPLASYAPAVQEILI